MKNPLLFLYRNDYSFTNQNGKFIERFLWEPIDTDFQGELNDEELQGNCFECELVIAEPIIENISDENEHKTEMVSFNVHAVSTSSINDWHAVINSYIIRSQASADKYPYIHLLWMLNYRNWSSDNVVNAINIYNAQSQSNIIRTLNKITKCLSVEKQQMMKNALLCLDFNYDIYSPEIIIEAINKVTPLPNGILEKGNIFNLVDLVLEDDEQNLRTRSIDEQTNNAFLNVYRWIHNEDNALIDYSILNSVYSLSSHQIQMDIVKRYFHDIRLCKTYLNTQLLEQFRESKYSEFIRYRYCLYTPDEPINLSVPLLCDCLLTVQQTQGKTFQTFNGVLDFVITHCDVTKPNINLGMEEFLPKCNGGAIYNRQFNGFIDYDIVFELDESRFTEENLLGSIRMWLDANCHHQTYFACGYDKKRRPLSEEMLQHCLSTHVLEENTPQGIEHRKVRRFECYVTCKYENKWVVRDTDYKWLNHFLKDPMPEIVDNHYPNHIRAIGLEQTSIEKMSNYIRSMANVCKKVDNKRFSIGSGMLKQMALLVQYSKPLTMRIKPQSLPVVGWNFDIFGIRRTLCQEKNTSPYNAPDIVKDEFKTKESLELRKRVVETLMDELNLKEFNGSFFEVPYDKELLRKLKNLYYFKSSIPDNPKEWQIEFLTCLNFKKHKPFCAPKISEGRDKATGLPYFWCRGLECFHNSLDQQTLGNCPSWHQYTLYHMIEIMGFPKLRETEAGYEPDEIITEFIACANRAMKKFRRLKCRACGHLMYTDKSSGYNRYNYYSCINPACIEYNHAIYLSYCYKCKKGLIDSRDTEQCPNGWYICPICLSCCDDNLYERQAQRYTLQNKPLPYRLESKLGHGHNDKGIFFCPNCGTQLLSDSGDDRDELECPKCHIKFDSTSFNNSETMWL